jgi:hypothetical protein
MKQSHQHGDTRRLQDEKVSSVILEPNASSKTKHNIVLGMRRKKLNTRVIARIKKNLPLKPIAPRERKRAADISYRKMSKGIIPLPQNHPTIIPPDPCFQSFP